MNNKDLIAQYVDTGLRLPKHQIERLPTWAKKTYLRKRLIATENGGSTLSGYEFTFLTEEDKIRYLSKLTASNLQHLLRQSNKSSDEIIKLYLDNIDMSEKHTFSSLAQYVSSEYANKLYEDYYNKYPTTIQGNELSIIINETNNPLYFVTKFLKSDYVLSILKTKIIEYMFQEISVVKFIRGLEGEEKDKVTLALLSNASPYNLEELIQKVFLLSSDNVKLKTLLSKTAPGNSGLLYTLIKIAPRGILIPFIKQLPNDYDLSDNSHPMYDLLPDEAKVIYDKRRLSEQMQKEQLPPKMIRVLSLEELLRNVTNKAGQKVLNGWIRQAKGAEMIKLSGKQQKLLTTIRGGGPNPKDYHTKY